MDLLKFNLGLLAAAKELRQEAEIYKGLPWERLGFTENEVQDGKHSVLIEMAERLEAKAKQ